MKTSSLIFAMLLAGLIISASGPVHGQFVTLARKIKSMHAGGADVAHVILEAKPFLVYRTIMDTLTTNKQFEISSSDNAKRFVEFTKQKNKISMQVDSLASGLTQITVVSAHSDKETKQPTDLAVEAIFRICKLLGISCTLDKP